MPRPDLAKLGVQYRRIPVLAIGRDVYVDTRLILRVLEELPGVEGARLGAATGAERFVEKLLERYMVEGPVFGMAAGLVPVDVAADPTFLADRQGMLGRSWSKEELEEGRGECLNYVRGLFDLFETTVLADGREWVLGSHGPKLADIEGECYRLSQESVSLVVCGLGGVICPTRTCNDRRGKRVRSGMIVGCLTRGLG